MIKFLLDANLSPQSSKYLIKLGFDSKSITAKKLGHIKDPEVVKIAKNVNSILEQFLSKDLSKLKQNINSLIVIKKGSTRFVK